MKPKVLHLSTYDNHGGAARAAYSLHRAMVNYGIDSKMVVGLQMTSDPRIQAVGRAKFRASRWSDHQLWRLQRSTLSTWRSPARFASLSADVINNSKADIVNLHWVTDGFLSVEEIGKIRKPIVWSLYDMWPFTGAEHYVPESAYPRWKRTYSRVSRSQDDLGFDLDRWTFNRKMRHWHHLKSSTILIPASKWLSKDLAASTLMGAWNVQRIPHTVEELFFSPIQQEVAKEALGLSSRFPLLLFMSSGGTNDLRKGWDLLERALPQVSSEYERLILLVVAPHPPSEVQQRLDASSSAQIVWFGNAKSSEDLRLLYSAADVTVVPSRQDNLPLVAMEAQTCGCPVVGFQTGGLSEIVVNQTTGRLAQPFDVEDLGRSLIATLGSRPRAACTERAYECWRPDDVAERYLQVYQETV